MDAEGIRAVRRRCRGPLVVPPEEAEPCFDLLRAGMPAVDVAQVLVLSGLLAPGQVPDAEEAALAVVLRTLRARRGCGYDVNDLILARPIDGQEHTAACPRCGRLHTWHTELEA